MKKEQYNTIGYTVDMLEEEYIVFIAVKTIKTESLVATTVRVFVQHHHAFLLAAWRNG